MELTSMTLIISLILLYTLLFNKNRDPVDMFLTFFIISIISIISIIVIKDLCIFHNMLQDYNINK